MKFGKRLREVVEESEEEWRPNFMNYKQLKKCISSTDDIDQQPEPKDKAGSDDEANRSSEQEQHSEFFTGLKREVDKVNDFFLEKLEDFIIEHRQLTGRVNLLVNYASRKEVNDMRERLIKFHGQLVVLEKFCTVNYTGFRKILKKHDKKTGASIQDAYLNTVLITPFFLSDTARKLIESTEVQLANLDSVVKFKKPGSMSSFNNSSNNEEANELTV